MTIFHPTSALIGGMMIGLAATIFLLFNGKILGVSGIIANSFTKPLKESGWGFLFLTGLIFGAFGYQMFAGEDFQIVIEASMMQTVLAGLLVGYGTRLGSGCTSGHGICGIARFSKRSIIATLTFMISGIITVFLVRHLWGGGL